jgi:SAM-dependent methyltransferase
MLNFDPAATASNLEPGPGGLWYARNRSQVSYPEEGNLNCLDLERDSFWFEHRNACILALVRRFPPPGVLLDVGGGNGYVTLGLQRGGIAAALLEPGEQGAQNAARRGVSPVICSTLEDAGFAPGSLAGAGLFDVLEHIPDDAAFLKTLANLLQPGGRLYLTVPAYPLLWSADDDYSGHFRRYTLAVLRSRLQAAGLVPDFASYFFFMLPLPIFLLRAIPTRLGLRKTNAWDSYRQEHSSRPGWTGRLLNRLLAWEQGRLSRGQGLAAGGSCLVTAYKP